MLGADLDAVCDDASLADAIDHRLRAFRVRGSARGERSSRPDLRLEFAVTGHGSLAAHPAAEASRWRAIYDTADGTILYHPDDDLLSGSFDGVAMRCDPARGLLCVEAAGYTGRRLYLASHPLTTIGLIELFKRRGAFNLHAACLSRGGRGVLLAGPSGAGKSTLALALVRAGLGFLGDDMVFLTRTGPAIGALAFPDVVGVTTRTAAFFPELAASTASRQAAGFPKRLVRVEDVFGARLVDHCVPSVLVFPEVVGDRPSRLSRLDPGEALLRLVPDVLLTESAATAQHVAVIAALLDQVSCHRLESGQDLARSAELVGALV
jgi:hypothetical protein